MKTIAEDLPCRVYVQRSQKDGDFHVGFTTDLPRRLAEHNSGRNTSTSGRRPFVLIHAEMYASEGDAIRRELYLKTAKGRRTLRRMLRNGLATGN